MILLWRWRLPCGVAALVGGFRVYLHHANVRSNNYFRCAEGVGLRAVFFSRLNAFMRYDIRSIYRLSHCFESPVGPDFPSDLFIN